jgi:hypothetical protein
VSARDHLSVRQFPVEGLKRAVANDFDETLGRDLPDIYAGSYQQKLTEHIKKHGIKEPIDLAAPNPEERRYQILTGHHRSAAAISLGLSHAPAEIHEAVRDEAGNYTYPSFDVKQERLVKLQKRKNWKSPMDPAGW